MIIYFAPLWILPAALLVSYHCAASGKLRRNAFFGLRVPSTLASEAAWRTGHRAALPVVWLSVPAVLASSLSIALTDAESPAAILWSTTALIVAILIGAVVVGSKAAHRVGKD